MTELTPPAIAMTWHGQGRPHEAVRVSEVPLGDGDVLVEIELATVCGSDLHTIAGRRRASTPLVLGHEQVGRVIEGTAIAVDGEAVIPGDRITWSVVTSCGECVRCRASLTQKCLHLRKFGHERSRRSWRLSGGFATHAHVPRGTAIVHVPKELPARVAAPASCATATVAAALDAAWRSSVLDDSTVLIAGGGMLGLTATAMATDAGARVILSDPDPRRRALALEFGALGVADPADAGSLPFALSALGPRRSTVGLGLEFSGATPAVAQLIDIVDVGGTVVLAGSVFPGASVPVDPRRIVTGLVTVTGVHNYAPHHLLSAIEYLTDAWRRWPFESLVGEVYPLADLDDAIASAHAAGSARVGIRP